MGPLDGLLPQTQNHGTPPRPTPHTELEILNSNQLESSEHSSSDSESEGNRLVRIFIDDENNPSFMASQPQNPHPDHKLRDSNHPSQIAAPLITSPPEIKKDPETLVKLPIPLPPTNQDTSPQPTTTVTPQQSQLNGFISRAQEEPPLSAHPAKVSLPKVSPSYFQKEIQTAFLLKPRSKPEPKVNNIIETPDDEFQAPSSENKRDRKKQAYIRPKQSKAKQKSSKYIDQQKSDVDPKIMRAVHLARQHEELLASRRFELKESFYCRRVKQQIFEGMKLNEYHRFWTPTAHKPGNLYAHHQNHIKEMLRAKRNAYLASRQSHHFSAAKQKKDMQKEMLEMVRHKDYETASRLEKMSNQSFPDRHNFGPPKVLSDSDFKAPVQPLDYKEKVNSSIGSSSQQQLVTRLENLYQSYPSLIHRTNKVLQGGSR